MTRRIVVTLTTISLPKVIGRLIEAAAEERPEVEIDYIIVGDHKTPAGTGAYLRSLAAKTPSRITYLDMDEQKRRFGHLGALWDHIPGNDFSRRNFGDLLAWQEGYDIVIRIDDDNFPVAGEAFFAGHAIAGTAQRLSVVSAPGGWYNVCDHLVDAAGTRFYPRGYPLNARWRTDDVTSEMRDVRVAVNAGLWLGDPDVDALTRLHRPVDVRSYDAALGPRFALAADTWCPINTQNTAYARHCIPAAFCSPFAARYTDILSGYFLRRIIDHAGESVTYGAPLLNQVRNVHDLWRDFDQERIGLSTGVELLAALRAVRLDGGDYAENLGRIATALRSTVTSAPGFYGPIFDGMELWAELFVSGRAKP